MTQTTVRCPDWNLLLKLKGEPAPNAIVRCPKCRTQIPLGAEEEEVIDLDVLEDDEEEESSEPARTKPIASANGHAKSVTADGPIKKKKKRKRVEEESDNTGKIVLLIGGGFFVLVLLGLGGFFGY